MTPTNREMLKQYKVKYSKQRSVVLSALKENDLPQCAEHVYRSSKRSLDKLSLSTVYRILNTFVEAGLAIKTNLDLENKTLFELNRHEHKHHLLCIECNKIMQISSCPLRAYEKELQEEYGYRVVSHKLEIYGYCPECLDKMDKTQRIEEAHHHG